jgi:hypothetical protein
MQNVGSSSQTGSLSVSRGAIPFSAIPFSAKEIFSRLFFLSLLMYCFEQHFYHIVNQSPWESTLSLHFFEKGLTILFLSLICTLAAAALVSQDYDLVQ